MVRLVSLTASLAALLLLALSGGQAAWAQQWIDHHPDGAGYRVAFPAQPREEVRDVNTRVGLVKMRTATVEIGDKAFMAIDSTYPVDVASGDPEANLDSARNGSVHNIDGKLVSEQRLNIGHAPARRMLIDIPQSGQAADALIVLDGRHLYQAVYVGPRGSQNTEDPNRFLSSFALER